MMADDVRSGQVCDRCNKRVRWTWEWFGEWLCGWCFDTARKQAEREEG